MEESHLHATDREDNLCAIQACFEESTTGNVARLRSVQVLGKRKRKHVPRTSKSKIRKLPAAEEATEDVFCEFVLGDIFQRATDACRVLGSDLNFQALENDAGVLRCEVSSSDEFRSFAVSLFGDENCSIHAAQEDEPVLNLPAGDVISAQKSGASASENVFEEAESGEPVVAQNTSPVEFRAEVPSVNMELCEAALGELIVMIDMTHEDISRPYGAEEHDRRSEITLISELYADGLLGVLVPPHFSNDVLVLGITMQVKQFKKRTVCITVHSKAENSLVNCSCFRSCRFVPALHPVCDHVTLVKPALEHFCEKFDYFLAKIRHRFLSEYDAVNFPMFEPIHFTPGWILGSTGTKKSSFLVFSKTELVFTLVEKAPIVWFQDQAQLSPENRLRVQCQTCNSRKQLHAPCAHEEACMRKDPRTVFLDDPSAAHLLGPAVRKENHKPQLAEGTNQGNKKSDLVSVSKCKRAIFPCPSEIVEAQRITEAIKSYRADGSSIILAEMEFCSNQSCSMPCAGDKSRIVKMERKAMLVTLLQGIAIVSVIDWICPYCNATNMYDGRKHALFRMKSALIFTRELVDRWVILVCYFGMSFRDAYFSKRSLTSCPSVMSTFGSENETRAVKTAKRRLCNDAFSLYLRLLDAPIGHTIEKLFSCSSCEIVTKDEVGTVLSSQLKGIVVDGTATGILGPLPSYKSPGISIKRASKIGNAQYFLKESCYRKSVSSLCRGYYKSVRSSIRSGTSILLGHAPMSSIWVIPEFKGGVKKVLKQRESLHYLYHTVISAQTNAQSSKEEVAMSFIRLYFPIIRRFSEEEVIDLVSNVRNRDSEIDQESSDSESDLDSHAHFSCIMPTSRAQFTLVSFVRCFLCESILGTLINCDETATRVQRLGEALISLSKCQCQDCLLSSSSNVSGTRTNRGSESNTDCYFCVEACKLSDVLSRRIPFLHQVVLEITEKTNSFHDGKVAAKDLIMSLGLLLVASHGIYSGSIQKYEWSRSTESKAYENAFMHVSADGRELQEWKRKTNYDGPDESNYQNTGILYPGRTQCRPAILFDTVDKEKEQQPCTKNYASSKTHSEGIFTVQCVCSHPRLLGISAMNSAETPSLAVSAALTHFPTPPSVLYYDNACNLTKSLALRLQWLFKDTIVLVDRFHYKSHSCALNFNPDSFLHLESHKTSGAESINARFALLRRHIRYLKGENLMPFLRVVAILLNIRAALSAQSAKSDIEEESFRTFLFSYMPCKCEGCSGS